jgi:hypothetical protein
LADLDGDGVPEIVVLTEGTLNVIRGDGTALAGFPVKFAQYTSGGSVPLLENCGVVVGDINGDSQPDLIFCDRSEDGRDELWAFDHNGVAFKDSPLTLSTNGGLPRGPAIGDIDLDGQTEIVVGSDDAIWAFRYGNVAESGPVLWGQFGHDTHHTNRY